MDNAAGCAAHTLIAIAFAADIVAGSLVVGVLRGARANFFIHAPDYLKVIIC